MRRRRLLAAFGTAAAGSLAGCGYAYGGGDVRRTERVAPGTLGIPQFAVGDGRVVGAANGRHWVFEGDEPEWVDGVELSVADLDGSNRWSHVHRTAARSVAVGGAVYLLDEAGRVVAVGGREVEAGDGRSTELEGEELWRTSVTDAGAPFVADERGVYVATGDGVAAVRDGAVAWRRSLSTPVGALWSFDGGVLVRGGGGLLALAGDGRKRWRRAISSGVPVSVAAGRALLARRDLFGIAPDRTVDWRLEWNRQTEALATNDGRAAVVGPADVRTVDAADGTRLWSSSVSVETETPVVGPTALYDASGCRAVAVDGSGRRWRRELDGDCRAVTGWIDGETVAFLFEGGEVVWFQRADQERGLL